MVSQIPPVLCPRCKKPVLGIDRTPSTVRRDLTEVLVYHLKVDDEPCRFKMTWKDSQQLANSISKDIGNRK